MCKYDFTGVRKSFASFDAEVKLAMDSVGREAVDYAVENGDYHDVTGRLRRSNEYSVDGAKLTISNSAPYAADVEARGNDVVGGAALYSEKRLKEIFEK